MSSAMLRVFHALPGPLRSLAATLEGYRLRRWRRGPDTERLIADALERDTWSPERWKGWEDERLAMILHRAATKVPYYREAWAKRRSRGDTASWERLENWPVLDKETLRSHNLAFVADGCRVEEMYADHTSGTTGKPVSIWLARGTVRALYALVEARTRCWHGIPSGAAWGHVGGQPVAAPGATSPPFWVWNAALRQLYLSAMHIAPWSARSYVEAIRDHRLAYVLGYASSLQVLATAALEAGIRFPHLKAVITDSEPLFDYQRRGIQEGFGCAVQETYGLCEYVCGASECASHRLHLWPEMGHVEILDADGNHAPPGAEGRLVGTSLLNPDMPFIRYDTLDRASLRGREPACGCSRGLPAVGDLSGRWDDVIYAKDGRLLVQIDRIFDPSLHIKEAQIVQEAIGKFTLRIVPAEGWGPQDAAFLRDALLSLVGEAEIAIEETAVIEKTWAGKLRVIVSKVGGQASRAAPPSSGGR